MEIKERKYANQRLWDDITESGFNAFKIDGNLCEGGSFSALASPRPEYETDHLVFNYGLMSSVDEGECVKGFDRIGIEHLTSFTRKNCGNYTKYILIFNNGQKSIISALRRRLPRKVEIDGKDVGFSNLVRTVLIDSRHSFFDIDSETGEYINAYLTLDLLRVNSNENLWGKKDRTASVFIKGLWEYIVPVVDEMDKTHARRSHTNSDGTRKRVGICFRVENLHKKPKVKIGFIDLVTHDCLDEGMDCELSYRAFEKLMGIVDTMEKNSRQIAI